MKRFAASVVLALASAVTVLSPAAAYHRLVLISFSRDRCWRLQRVDLQWRFFRHPVRRVRRSLRSCYNKVRSAGQAGRLSKRTGGDHV